MLTLPVFNRIVLEAQVSGEALAMRFGVHPTVQQQREIMMLEVTELDTAPDWDNRMEESIDVAVTMGNWVVLQGWRIPQLNMVDKAIIEEDLTPLTMQDIVFNLVTITNRKLLRVAYLSLYACMSEFCGDGDIDGRALAALEHVKRKNAAKTPLTHEVNAAGKIVKKGN